MKIKTKYNSTEFKERQGSFEFYCSAAYEFLLKFKKNCLKGWSSYLKKPAQSFFQEVLDFTKADENWAFWTHEKNMQLFS